MISLDAPLNGLEAGLQQDNWGPRPMDLRGSEHDRLVGNGTERDYNFSFADQMHELNLITTGKKIGFFLTAYSALPMAHAVRGYYETLSSSTAPSLTYIEASYKAMKHMAGRPAEVSRIARFIKEQPIDHAVIIDQFTVTGKVLVFATDMLREAGVELHEVSQIAGRWYRDVSSKQGDHKESVLAFMEANTTDERLAKWLYGQGAIAAKSRT